MEFIIIIAIIYFIIKALSSSDSSSNSNSSPTISTTSQSTSELINFFFDRENHGEITDYQSYYKTLREYYEQYGKDMFIQDVMISFLHGYRVYENLGLSVGDIERDLRKISRGEKPEQTISNTISNKPDTVNDRNSYMKMLKQYYSRYGEEAFLYSEIQRFRNSNRLDKLGITPNDVIEDLLKIKKSADITQDKTTTPPVQAQRTQTQNANAIQPEEYGHDYLEKRGVDKDFGIRNDEHGDFYFFVINMSNTELINTINNQYKAIKGTWTLAPCMGEYGCIEFAVTLLLWKYAVINFNKNQKAYASLQIMLGDLICCAFFGMPAGEWSDKADPIINAHTDILSYEEFGNVYNYLRNNHADRIHSLEFNEGNAEKEAYRHLYTKFTETYNSSDGFTEILNFYTANGLKIKEDMHFNVANENKDILKSLLVREWKSVWGELKEDAQIQQLSPTITDKFYVSSYRCPICGRHMYKTVFPIGSEFPIRTENGYISMKRIFTCKPCLSFFTPLPECKLSCGQYYSLRLDTPAEYDLLLETYDNHGTIYGRPDA